MSVDHPILGRVSGNAGDGVVQFLGIKYATLQNWLSPAEPVKYGKNEVIDATSLGPRAISPPSGCAMEMGFIQQTLPIPEATMSGTECLHLNITIPECTLDSPQKYPVFLFVHGGGFAIGANCWPQYDLARLVARSAKQGAPVIGVGVNYRVGAAGFLTSSELREAGYHSNNGISDQAHALRWIQEHIAGFGGDPDQVTFLGESAGAASGHYHLQSETPLFKRFASLAGSSLAIPGLPPPVTEFAYSATCQALDLQALSAQDRVQALVNTSADDILAKLGPQIPLMPAFGAEMVPRALSYTDLAVPGTSWCRELFIGDCQMDAMIFEYMLAARKTGIGKAFIETTTRVLSGFGHPSSAINSFLEAYNLGEESVSASSDADTFVNILNYAQDIGFLAPTVAIARHWARVGNKAYVYRFNEPNPWTGPWKGHATHVLDVAYLFLNFEESLLDEQRQVAYAFADDFIAFVNGKQPWQALGADAEGVQVYGPSGDHKISEYVNGLIGGETGRRDTIYSISENVPLDHLSAVWATFLPGL